MVKRISAVAHAWGHYECASLAAGVAFYAALSLFPLMMVLVAGVGYFFRFVEKGADAREEILEVISTQMSPEVAQSLAEILSQVQDRALVNGPIAAAAFFLTASLVFTQIDRGFYRIWDVKKKAKHQGLWAKVKLALSSRLRSFLIILGLCFFVVVMFVGGLTLRGVSEVSAEYFPSFPSVSRYTTFAIGSVVNVIILTLLYRFLSKESVSRKLCFMGSLVAAGLWEVGSRIFTAISVTSSFSVYGLIGSFLVVLLWVYFNVMVLFIGGLIVRVEHRAGRMRKK